MDAMLDVAYRASDFSLVVSLRSVARTLLVGPATMTWQYARVPGHSSSEVAVCEHTKLLPSRLASQNVAEIAGVLVDATGGTMMMATVTSTALTPRLTASQTSTSPWLTLMSSLVSVWSACATWLLASASTNATTQAIFIRRSLPVRSRRVN